MLRRARTPCILSCLSSFLISCSPSPPLDESLASPSTNPSAPASDTVSRQTTASPSELRQTSRRLQFLELFVFFVFDGALPLSPSSTTRWPSHRLRCPSHCLRRRVAPHRLRRRVAPLIVFDDALPHPLSSADFASPSPSDYWEASRCSPFVNDICEAHRVIDLVRNHSTASSAT